MELLKLFPSNVMIDYIDENLINSSLNSILETIQHEEHVYGKTDLVTTTNDDLHKIIEFQDLVKVINRGFQDYLTNFNAGSFNDYYMSGMWANIHNSNFMHHSHKHPNAVYSGVVYLDIPETAEHKGTLVFDDPTPNSNIQPDSVESRLYSLFPKTTMVVYFPAWLQHGTDRYYDSTGKRRVCVSFNYNLRQASGHTMKI